MEKLKSINKKHYAKKFFILSFLFLITYFVIVNAYINPSNKINMLISNIIEKYKAKLEASSLKPITSNGNCRIVNTIEAIEHNYYIALGYAVEKERFPHQWAVINPDKADNPDFIVDKSVEDKYKLIYKPKLIIKLDENCNYKIIKKLPMDKYTKWLVMKGITYTVEFCKSLKKTKK